MGVQRISYAFRFSDSTITVHAFEISKRISACFLAVCMWKKSVLYICTLIARHHSHQLIAVSLIRRSCHFTDGGFRKLRQSSFLVVPPGCSNSQNYTIVLRRRLPPCCVSLVLRHTLYDVSNRSCLLLTLREATS